MTFILNEYDVENARLLAEDADSFPEFQRAVLTLVNLVNWANDNSDGWAYWAKPANAATRLQHLVRDHSSTVKYGDGFGGGDLDEAELVKALTPIKAFLTRQGVDHDVVIAPTLEEVAREQVQAELRQAWADQVAEKLRFEVEALRIAHLFPSWSFQQVNAYAVRSLEYEDALAELT